MSDPEPKLPGPIAGIAMAFAFPLLIALGAFAAVLNAAAVRAFSRPSKDKCSRDGISVTR